MRHALVKNGVVINVVLWNGTDAWEPPAGSVAIPCGPEVAPGFTYSNGVFTDPNPPPPNTPPLDQGDIDNLQKQMKALALVVRSYCNALKAGTYANKSMADLKADFKQAFDSLP